MAIKKYVINPKSISEIGKDEAETLFKAEAISKEKTTGLVASSNVKRIEILNELPSPELQEEGVLYGIYM